MRALWPALLLALSLLTRPAMAAERGIVIRPADLMEQPFIDAAKAGSVAANEPVDILQRQGAWVRVQAGGKSGWVRSLNLRMGSAMPATGQGNSNGAAMLLRTGSSGRTVTTGVKGLDEEKIRNASPDPDEVAKLDAFTATTQDAQALAAADKLTENKLDYLKKGKVK